MSGVHLTDLDRLKGYEYGAVDYVPVPVVPEILRAKVAVFADLFRKTVALQKLNEELERRVLERTAELRESEARFWLKAHRRPEEVGSPVGNTGVWTQRILSRQSCTYWRAESHRSGSHA